MVLGSSAAGSENVRADGPGLRVRVGPRVFHQAATGGTLGPYTTWPEGGFLVRPMQLLVIALVGLATCAPGAPAQGTDFLFWTEFDSGPVGSATIDLGLRGDISRTVGDFLIKLDRTEFPLVLIRVYFALDPATEAQVIAALQEHLDRGGRLMVSFAELDEMPAMQRFLGLDGAIDIAEPKQFIREARVPVHPAAGGGFLQVSGEPPILDDIGDVLLPGVDTKPIFVFDDDETVAAVLGRNGQVIVNGWEWSEWPLSDGRRVAIEHIRWLISCPSDLSRDGALDLFDYLEFQRLFDVGVPSADWFCYDGRLDVFDFLAFFNAFEVGCP